MMTPMIPLSDYAANADPRFPAVDVERWATGVADLRWGGTQDFVWAGCKNVHWHFEYMPAGTGVLADRGRLLTAAHVCSPPADVPFPAIPGSSKPFYDAVRLGLKVAFRNDRPGAPVDWCGARRWSFWGKKSDAAAGLLLSTPLLARRRVSPVNLAPPEPGEPVCIIHHPEGRDAAVSIGPVIVPPPGSFAAARNAARGRMDCITYEADTAGGSSGGPVFNTAGELVAMHIAMEETPHQRWGVGVSAAAIRRLTGLI